MSDSSTPSKQLFYFQFKWHINSVYFHYIVL
uniref:Uncharacterized protein n=1 Tax=Anguilla anguilla TaxID=7936 RepID=A0A0E9TNE8_ANGAN